MTGRAVAVDIDPAVASYCAAIVSGLTAAGALVARAIRWAARSYRAAVLSTAEVIRENTAAFNRVAELLGRVDARTADIVREQTGPVPLVRPEQPEAPNRLYPRPDTKTKGR